MLEENQPERDVLVVGRLEVLAQLVGGKEQLRLEAEIGAVAVGLGGLLTSVRRSRSPASFFGRPLGMNYSLYLARGATAALACLEPSAGHSWLTLAVYSEFRPITGRQR